jgi:hypothetical protein
VLSRSSGKTFTSSGKSIDVPGDIPRSSRKTSSIPAGYPKVLVEDLDVFA